MRSVVLAILAALFAAPAAHAFDPAAEAQNFSRIAQRFVYDQSDPAYHADHTSTGLLGIAEISCVTSRRTASASAAASADRAR